MKNFIKQKINTRKAFTLVEALVAISILMIAIASPMTLAQKGLSTAILSKDQMIASFLAQDAIETVKNIRDQIKIRGNTSDWLNGTILDNCICDLIVKHNCDFDSLINLKFCTIDTTSFPWRSGPGSIEKGSPLNARLRISYSTDSNNINSFLKYDYSGMVNGNLSSDPDTYSKFYRYINIHKTSNLDEAIVNVRVSWSSSLGIQNIDISNFIYNI